MGWVETSPLISGLRSVLVERSFAGTGSGVCSLGKVFASGGGVGVALLSFGLGFGRVTTGGGSGGGT
jgi:hypothetical protein